MSNGETEVRISPTATASGGPDRPLIAVLARMGMRLLAGPEQSDAPEAAAPGAPERCAADQAAPDGGTVPDDTISRISPHDE